MLRLLLILALAAAAIPAFGQLIEPEEEEKEPATTYSRFDVPGHYTVGLYADESGSSTELQIPKDAVEFNAWLGLTGDSTRVFSGMAMSMKLPGGVELAGPIVWKPRSNLKQSGVLVGDGITVEFNRDCVQQKGLAPVIIARIPLRIQPGINEVRLSPAPNLRFGLTVELCNDADAWPKPYADPVELHVRRKLSLWDRITGWFH